MGTDKIIKLGKEGEIEKITKLNPDNCFGVDSFEEGMSIIKGYLDELNRTQPDPAKRCGILNVLEMFSGISGFLDTKEDFEKLLAYINITPSQFKEWANTMGESCSWSRRFID